MRRKALSAGFLLLIAVASPALAFNHGSGTVLEVTPDTIKIKTDTATVTYEISNELLTNTANNFIMKGKITEVKPGCKVLFDLGGTFKKPVVAAIEGSK